VSVFDQFAKVQAAQLRMNAARQELSTPAAALLARGHAHPLSTVGVAAGAGFVLGSLNVHPLRVPGVGPLLSGGLADAVAFGTRMIAELGASGLAGAGRSRDESGVHDVEDGERS
jgi:hypothetical protein